MSDIKYIILTHGHSDHICGVNEHKAEFPDAKIVAYKDEEADAGKSEPEPESGIWRASIPRRQTSWSAMAMN